MTQAVTLQNHAVVLVPPAKNEEKAQDFTNKVSAWSGHTIEVLEQGCHRVLSGVICTIQGIFNSLSALSKDSNALAAFFRKLDKHVLTAIEHFAKMPEVFSKLGSGLKTTVGFIDTVQVASDIDYIVNGKYKKDNNLSFGGRIFGAIADLGGALLWLEEMAFFNLSKAATAIGEVRIFSFAPKLVASIPGVKDVAKLQHMAASLGELRVFGFVTKISLGFVAERALTLCYVFFAAESLKRLVEPGTSTQKVQAGLDLASYVSELVLDALLTVGVTSVVGLGVAGTTCLVLALASFLHKVLPAQPKPQPKQEIQVVATKI